MQNIRESLNNLPIQKKQKVMSVFIGIFLIIFFMISLLAYRFVEERIDIQDYQTKLNEYVAKYKYIQEKYRKFAFYQSNTNLVLRGKMEIDDNYEKGIRQFANFSDIEFTNLVDDVLHFAIKKKFNTLSDFQGNFNYDWSQWDTPVKDDQYFNIGNIFAVVAAIEFHYKILKINQNSNNTEVDLSEQQIYDCCQECRNVSDPKSTYNVYKYIMANGLMTQQDYPYTNSIFKRVNKEDIKCSYQKEKALYSITGYKKVKRSCAILNNQIQNGPIVVGIDARQLRSYDQGIFSQCSTNKVTHYALLIGKGINYWKLRNNWGNKWGNRGYFKIKDQNSCNICVRASYPTFN